MPWQRSAVEVMSRGRTDPAALELAMRALAARGLRPFQVRAEHTGCIYNRGWAAIKRQALLTGADGAATPADVDSI